MGADGVSNNTSKPATQYSTLKLKGKDGKTIDLNKLEGLQKTKGNEAIFKTYDKDGDGIINKEEALAMRNNLQSLAGNGTISKRELNALFDKDTDPMEALNKLADQQATAKGAKYTEVNGNTTTEFYNSAFGIEKSDRKDITKNADGSTTTVYQDGSTQITQKDGSYTCYNKAGSPVQIHNADGSGRVLSEDGTVTVTDANGGKTVYKDGMTTTVGQNKSVTKNTDGETIESLELKDGQEIRTKYEQKDGQTIAREYNETDGKSTPGAVTVSGKQNGNQVETRYASEADRNNNRPSEMTENPQNPTLKTTTKYSYDAHGNVKMETTNSANEVTTTFKDAQGNEIDGSKFDGDQSYTVYKNETISNILSNTLKNQGIDPESLSAEQMKDYRNQLLEANKDSVQTYNGPKTEWKGNKFFYANTKLNVPKFGAGAEKTDGTAAPQKTVAGQTTVTAHEAVKNTHPTDQTQAQQQVKEPTQEAKATGSERDGGGIDVPKDPNRLDMA